MATYLEQYQLGEDPAFQRRVQIALTAAAGAVVAAPPTNKVEPARAALASLDGADAITALARRVARIAATLNPAAASAPTGGALTDAQLLNLVDAILPYLTR